MRPYHFAPPVTDEPRRARAETSPLSRRWLPRVAAVVTAGSGLLNLASLLAGPVPATFPLWVRDIFPLDFAGLSRSATLLLGFALILCSIHLWGRKRRALRLAAGLALASAAFHFTKGWDLEEAIFSLAVAAFLIRARCAFPVRSGRPNFGASVRRAATALAVTLGYGVTGFWLLNSRDFGRNFHWWNAAIATLRIISFSGDNWLVPRTAYAGWFLQSLYLLAGTCFLYCGYVLFRPVAYRFRFEPLRCEQAKRITERYGKSGQDFFKQWDDNSFFFSHSGEAFIAYQVGGHFALVLGDPVGPEDEIGPTIASFIEYCRERGWGVGFHQVGPQYLMHYLRLGLRRIKIGDEAIVDLTRFSLIGKGMKEFRNAVNRLGRNGVSMNRYDAPLPPELLIQLRAVSNAWLSIPGHRERRFTLGRFDEDYLRSTTVHTAEDRDGRVIAFLNLVPSYRPGLATVDLMRRRPDTPNGTMDFLFARTFLELAARGYDQFSLGMVPFGDWQPGDYPNAEERAVRFLMRRAPWLFRADSLRRFKSKYAHMWEPRYDVYTTRLDLPRLGMTLRRVSELPRQRRRVA